MKTLLKFLAALGAVYVFPMAAQVTPAGGTYTWPTITAAGATEYLNLQAAGIFTQYTVAVAPLSVSPAACTYRIEGSPDGVSWTTIDRVSPLSCVSANKESFSSTPYPYIHVNVLTYSAGSGNGVSFSFDSVNGGGGGNTTSTSLTTGSVPKANGPNSVISSSLSDDGTTVTSAEPVTVPQLTITDTLPGIFYSAAGTALPACAAGIQGETAVVKDATAPTYMGAYASGGAITAQVICSFNGSVYAWLTK